MCRSLTSSASNYSSNFRQNKSGWLIVRLTSPVRSKAKEKESLHVECEPGRERQRRGAWSVLRPSRCYICRNSIEPPQRCCATAFRPKILFKRHTCALGKHFPVSLPGRIVVHGF